MNPGVETRTAHFSTEDRSHLQGSFFVPLLTLLQMERTHTVPNRREITRETPPWYLLFKNSYYNQARDFLHQSVCAIIALESNPFYYDSFHSETGVLTRNLVEYLRSVEDADKLGDFVAGYKSYLMGQRKRMPRNISYDLQAYENLKSIAKADYTKRLIEEHNAGSVSSKTQDYVVLFKMPTFALLETFFCAITDEDIAKAIEEYRE